MNVINKHVRVINQPHSKIGILLDTLATENDKMLATDKWPRMKLDKGLQTGSAGGHGPIRYFVKDYFPGKSIIFQFDLPGFDGFHRFDINALDSEKAEIVHLIKMKTTGTASVKWLLAIRWLHDAYIEDAFDKIENHFSQTKKISPWSLWVKFLRWMMKS